MTMSLAAAITCYTLAAVLGSAAVSVHMPITALLIFIGGGLFTICFSIMDGMSAMAQYMQSPDRDPDDNPDDFI